MLARGAEGELYIEDEKTLRKIRPEKPYRHPMLDRRIRQFRVRREFKVLSKLHEAGVHVPAPLTLDEDSYAFTMTLLPGTLLKECLDETSLFAGFDEIIKMHNQHIVHGDLTTMNLLLSVNEVYIMDFGLADFSHKAEDKAVDLHLFFTCLKNEHPEHIEKKEELEERYRLNARHGEKIIKRSEEIANRGRNKGKNQ